MLSCHRRYLDAFLTRAAPRMRGRVLDIGGSRVRKRGAFLPPVESATSWEYLNIAPAAEPDYLCCASRIPLEDATCDTFLLCEVLEHVELPEQVLSEAARILRPGGQGVITMPFLYPVHGDPGDYQRWTAEKLRRELDRLGLTVDAIEALGGPAAVVHDLLYNVVWRSPGGLRARVLAKLLAWSVRPTLWLDRRAATVWPQITSGWGVIVIKPPVRSGSQQP